MKILIVDDEKNLLEVLSILLTKHGYEVTTCATVSEGVKQVECCNFDACILDYHVGPDKGIIVADAIHRFKPNLPYIYLSGYHEDPITDAKVLSKPIGTKELINELETLVGGK